MRPVEKRRFFFFFSPFFLPYGVFMEYSWGIRGVFMGYTYVSGMYRVCVGYVSGMYRNIWGAKSKNDTQTKNEENYTKIIGD